MSWRVGQTLTYERHTPPTEVLSATLTLTAGGVLAGMPDIVINADIIGGKAVWEIPADALGYYSNASGTASLSGGSQATFTLYNTDDPTAPILRPAGQRGAVFIYDGELWDTAEHGLFCTALSVGSPEVRQNKREALARDGFIDLTEQFGRPVFGNRTISWRFLVTEEDWQTRCAEVRDFIADLHGREVGILVDDYEGWMFTGRLALERVVHQLDGTYVEVTADCDPFRRDGSEYSLDAEAESFTLGPSEMILPSRDLKEYLADPGTYTLTIGSSASALSEWQVFIAGNNLAYLSEPRLGSSYIPVSSEYLSLSPEVEHVSYMFGGPDSAYHLVVPPVPGGTDLYCYPWVRRRFPGDEEWWTGSIIIGETETEFIQNTAVKVAEVSQDGAILDPRSRRVVHGPGRANFALKFYLLAVPHGDEPPAGDAFLDIACAVKRLFAQGSGNFPVPFDVECQPFVLEDFQGMTEPVFITVESAVDATTGNPVTATVTFDVNGTAIQDLSELGHRFFALTGTIPPASDPDDPEYIDIDGRRYYADELSYTIKANAGYRSRVSVHGSGPALTAEGLAI